MRSEEFAPGKGSVVICPQSVFSETAHLEDEILGHRVRSRAKLGGYRQPVWKDLRSSLVLSVRRIKESSPVNFVSPDYERKFAAVVVKEK